MQLKFLLYLFFLLPAAIWADSFTGEVRSGLFFPKHAVQEIYKKRGLEFELEGSRVFGKQFSMWQNVNGLRWHGKSIGERDKTTMQLYAASMGVNYTFPLHTYCNPYLGVGVSYAMIRLHDKSPFLKQRMHKYGWGGVAKSGLVCLIGPCLFLDLFLDYYYTKMTIETVTLNVGGFRSGLGIGWRY